MRFAPVRMLAVAPVALRAPVAPVALRGLPALGQPLASDPPLYAAYQSGDAIVFPDGTLAIATGDDGKPDFQLELIQLGDDAGFGLLDFRVVPRFDLGGAQKVLRRDGAAAVVRPVDFAGGFLRLIASGVGPAHELIAPAALAWNQVGVARCRTQLDAGDAATVAAFVETHAWSLRVFAELEVAGVSPQLDGVDASFEPRALLTALAPGDPERRTSWGAIYNQLAIDLGPIAIAGPLDQRRRPDLIAALADRVRLDYGTPVPAPVPGGPPTFTLTAPADAEPGLHHWDLALPVVAARPIGLALDVLAASSAAVTVSHTVIAPLPDGTLDVAVAVHLPTPRPALAAVMVDLHADANLAVFRPMPIDATVTLDDDGQGAVTLQFSPGETPAYTVSVRVVWTGAGEQHEASTVPIDHQGDRVELGPDDLPVELIPLAATDRLLQLATVTATCRWTAEGHSFTDVITLDGARPACMLAVPRGATVALAIAAAARTGAGRLPLAVGAGLGGQLDLTSFAEYGLQEVAVSCAVAAGQVAIYDACPDGGTDVTALVFDGANPTRSYRYAVDDPFHAGFRVRRHAGVGEPPAPWGPLQSPFAALALP